MEQCPQNSERKIFYWNSIPKFSIKYVSGIKTFEFSKVLSAQHPFSRSYRTNNMLFQNKTCSQESGRRVKEEGDPTREMRESQGRCWEVTPGRQLCARCEAPEPCRCRVTQRWTIITRTPTPSGHLLSPRTGHLGELGPDPISAWFVATTCWGGSLPSCSAEDRRVTHGGSQLFSDSWRWAIMGSEVENKTAHSLWLYFSACPALGLYLSLARRQAVESPVVPTTQSWPCPWVP